MSRNQNINFARIFRVIGFLLVVEALFMLVPMATALYYGENDYYAFAVGATFTALTGWLLWGGVRNTRRDLSKRDGFLLTGLVWVCFSLLGTVPLMLSSLSLGFTDAFTETMSGFTTTGFSVVDDVENLSRSVLLWRCLTQWIGGMGIILFTLAVLPALNSNGGMQLMSAEVTGITQDKIQPRVSQTAKRMWLIYIILTVLASVLLTVGPMTPYESICHALTTVSSGGFSTHSDSLMSCTSTYVKVVIMIFMFIAGINFAIIYRASTGNIMSSWKDEALRNYVKLIVAMTVLIWIVQLARGWGELDSSSVIDPMFQVVSAVSTTGNQVTGWQSWGPLVFPLFIIVMGMGACAGSTSGGAKIDRVTYVFKNTINEVKRCIFPRRIYPLSINGKVQSPEIINKVMAFLWIYTGLIAVGAILLILFDLPAVDAILTSMSSVSNSAVGHGVTAGSIASVPDAGKWVINALMLTGRLEVFTILVLLLPGFWRK